jgi:hypothetical protein
MLTEETVLQEHYRCSEKFNDCCQQINTFLRQQWHDAVSGMFLNHRYSTGLIRDSIEFKDEVFAPLFLFLGKLRQYQRTARQIGMGFLYLQD